MAGWCAGSVGVRRPCHACQPRVDPVVARQFGEQLGMGFIQRRRLLEEVFADDREEFGRVGGAVGVDQTGDVLRQPLLQRPVLAAHHRRPARIAVAPCPEPRCSVGAATGLIELVREFVDDHVVAVVRVGRACQHIAP